MAGFQVLLSGLRRAEQTLSTQLASIRDTISTLEIGSAVSPGVPGRKRGRPAGSKNKPVARKRRKLSAKARAAISKAQKARWAKQKASEKK